MKERNTSSGLWLKPYMASQNHWKANLLLPKIHLVQTFFEFSKEYIFFYCTYDFQFYIISDAPDAPGTPQVTDYSAKSVDLEWTPPADDGGRPVTGYIIEKREKGSPDWFKVNNYPSPDTKFTVPNLKEGTTYEFRVMAVNDAGPGKPSRATQPVTAKDKQCMS